MIELSDLNACAAPAFVAALDGIFEHSPWVAERAAALRPFGSRLDLLDAMRAVVDDAPPALQLALIRAHPQLGTRGRADVPLTAASAREQKRAGLDACTHADLARLEQLNTRYVERFDMPFILAVRGFDPPAIIARCESRVTNDVAAEVRAALREIGLIAGYRLADAVASRAAVEVGAMRERWLRCAPGAAAVALLRDWMQAAHLACSGDSSGMLEGLRRGIRPQPVLLLLGMSVDAASGALGYDGLMSCLVGIAVTIGLWQRNTSPAIDWLIVARPGERRLGAWDGFERMTTAAVPWPGQAGKTVALARGAGAGDPGDAQFDPEAVEGAARSLEEFMTRYGRP